MTDKPVIFVIGGPGCGKGTQCEKIVSKYGFTHLSTGDLLRDEVKSGSERGKRLNAIMESGQLVPLEEVLGLLKDAIKKNDSNSKGFLIDGYPREVDQAIKFEEQVSKCTFVIYFDVSDSVMVQRLLKRGETSGRIDDNEETIKKRLATFHQHSDPILSHYKDKLVKISGERLPEEIFLDVCKAIEDKCK
ncbi:adenylate kinase isoenzyme 1 [Tetranychus urticae]|uniref:adenylate kinase n=1 Tax=Tetranychus urticae TaxID=32264 RepID=T1L074_TETUR|nr:adenylate kinase isoenzyme 1 [Tetranychus urticae]